MALNSEDINYDNLARGVRRNKYEEVTKILNTTNSFINEKGDDGKTVLLTACFADKINMDMIELLINHGADINIPSDDGNTCLSEACDHGDVELVKFLLKYNCNLVDISDKRHVSQYSYLHKLARGNRCETEILNLIMKHPNSKNVNINVQDIDGYTPLMVAVEEGNIKIAKLLIEYGADINITSSCPDHTSILHLCVRQDIDLFDKLFDLVDFSVVEQSSSTNNLVDKMLTYFFTWYDSSKINILMKVLSHPQISSVLVKANVFDSFFTNLIFYDIDAYDLNIVITRLLELHLPFKTDDFVNFVRIVNETVVAKVLPNTIDLMVRNGGLNVDHKEILINVLIIHPKLIFTLMKYCIKYNYKHIFEFIINNNYSNPNIYSIIIEILKFYTPPLHVVRNLYRKNTDKIKQCDSKNFILKDFNRFPSLLELTRDAVRSSIKNNVRNSKEYIEFMDGLLIPEDFYNILSFRIPMYYQ